MTNPLLTPAPVSRRIGRMAAFMLLLGTSTATAADAAATVRLHPSAVVTSDQITLADIASFEGQAAELAAHWSISSAPLPGQSRIITHRQLERILDHHGANLSQWIIRGAMRCTVQRPAEPERGAAEAVVSADVQARSAAEPQPVAQPRTLEAQLIQHIGDRIAELGGRPIVRFARGSESYLKLSEPTYTFRITDTDDALLGHVGVNVTVYEGNEVCQTIPMLADVAVARDVVVADRNINRGQVIVADDVRMTEQIFDRIDDLGLTDVDMVVGQRARKLIREQTRIGPRDIEMLPLVERNETVKVRARHHGFVIETTAKATESGGLGDVVRLRNERSGDSFTGTVVGRRAVEVTVSTRMANATGVNR